MSKPKIESQEDWHDNSLVETTELGSPSCLVVGMDCRSMNLYRFLRVRFPRASRSTLQEWLRNRLVLVNGSPMADSTPLRTGDVVEIDADVSRFPQQKDNRIQILYEDDSICIVNKPAGLPSTPEGRRGIPDVVTLLQRQWKSSVAGAPKVVHRIDKQSSGIVVLARNRDAKRTLIEEFSRHRVSRDFLALVSGHIQPEPQVIRAALAPMSGRRTCFRVVEHGGREAITLLRRVFEFRGYSFVQARPLFGRAHQVRVHLKSVGNSIVGDTLYQGEATLRLSHLKPDYHRSRGEAERPLLSRLALHAARIRLRSPAGNEWVTAEAPLPKDLKATLKQLQKHLALAQDEEFEAALRDPYGPLQEDPFESIEAELALPPESIAMDETDEEDDEEPRTAP